MPVTPASSPVDTLASRAARANLRANLNCLSHTQPELAVASCDRESLEWVFARDGFVSALTSSGTWLADCSVPLLAAQEFFREMRLSGSVVCMLLPTHAAQVLTVTDAIAPGQAQIVIVPEPADLSQVLHCADFTRAIASHSLWFAVGPDWSTQLAQLLSRHDGLGVPTQFVRLPITPDDVLLPFIQEAQKVFTRIASQRQEKLKSLAPRHRHGDRQRIVIAAPMRFRLWQDHGHALHSAVQQAIAPGTEIDVVDLDDPLCASALHLAQVTRGADALCMVDATRTDLPGVVDDSVRWVTWSTGLRAIEATGGHDRVIVSAPDRQQRPPTSNAQAAPVPNRRIKIVCDLPPLDPPRRLEEFSSQRLLWQLICEELIQQPLSTGANPEIYLRERAARVGVDPAALPVTQFLNELIQPAFAVGVANVLRRAGLPLDLHGAGWEAHPKLQPHAQGRVSSREDLGRLIESGAVLVHVWPGARWHPVDSTGLHVLPTGGLTADALVSEARRLLSTTDDPVFRPALDPQLVRETLARRD